MRKISVSACIITVMVIMLAAPVSAAEELFDTATAAKRLEQGVAFLKAKKFDSAIKEFEEAATVNPDAEAYYYLGYAFYLKGRNGDEESRKKARDNFEKAYEIDPNFSPTRYKPAEPAQTKGQPQNQKEPAEPQITPANPAPLQTQPAEPTPSSEQQKQ